MKSIPIITKERGYYNSIKIIKKAIDKILLKYPIEQLHTDNFFNKLFNILVPIKIIDGIPKIEYPDHYLSTEITALFKLYGHEFSAIDIRNIHKVKNAAIALFTNCDLISVIDKFYCALYEYENSKSLNTNRVFAFLEKEFSKNYILNDIRSLFILLNQIGMVSELVGCKYNVPIQYRYLISKVVTSNIPIDIESSLNSILNDYCDPDNLKLIRDYDNRIDPIEELKLKNQEILDLKSKLDNLQNQEILDLKSKLDDLQNKINGLQEKHNEFNTAQNELVLEQLRLKMDKDVFDKNTALFLDILVELTDIRVKSITTESQNMIKRLSNINKSLYDTVELNNQLADLRKIKSEFYPAFPKKH